MDIRPQPSTGWIEVITGSMFSGKSEELIRRLRRAQIARQRVQIFKPKIDSRYADDHIIGHHTWSYLLAWQHFANQRPPAEQPKRGRLHFKNAAIVIDRRGSSTLFLALNKGGVFKLFRGEHLVHSDTNFSVQIDDGKTRNAVAHMVGKYDVEIADDEIAIQGHLGWAKTKQMTTFNLVVLRALMFTVGRFFPDLIRKLLQKLLITGKKSAPFAFSRCLRWNGEQIELKDELTATSWEKVRAVGIGGSQTSIYVVMSRTYQAGQLQPWLNLTDEARRLQTGESLKLERLL